MDELLVLWPYDADPMTDAEVTANTRIAAANQNDLDKLASVTVRQIARMAANEVEMTGVDLGPISGGATSAAATVVANGPAGQNRKYEAKVGWYRINGTNVEATAGKRWLLWWNGSTWALVDMGALSTTRTTIPAWTAGSYSTNEVVEYGDMIYRANKLTTAIPVNTAGVVSPDWELIGGGKLDEVGGALSFERGELIESSLKYFLEENELPPSETLNETVNKDTTAYRGITAQEGTVLRATNGTTTYSAPNERYFVLKDIPTTHSNGMKLRQVRYQGEVYNLVTDAVLVGIRPDNSVQGLIVGGQGSAQKDITVNVRDYAKISIGGFRNATNPAPIFTLTYATDSAAGLEDAVKNYIDLSVANIEIPLNESGGALGYERGQALETIAKSFLDGSVFPPEPAETISVDKNSTGVRGAIRKDNTILKAGGAEQTYPAPSGEQFFVFKDIPTKGAGVSMTTVRYRGLTYLSAGDANLIGVKENGEVVNLIVGNNVNTPKDITLNVEEFVRLHLAMFVTTGNADPTVTLQMMADSQRTTEDAIKEYIDIRADSTSLLVDSKLDKSFVNFKYLDGSLSSVPVDLKNGSNFILEVTLANHVLVMSDTKEFNQTVNIFLNVTAANPTVVFNKPVAWQNGVLPNIQTGYSYFILLNTFDGGSTYLGSIIGYWEASSDFVIDEFDRADISPIVNSANFKPYSRSAGDVWAIHNRRLVLTTMVGQMGSLFTSTGGTDYIMEISFPRSEAAKVMVIGNVIAQGETFSFFGWESETVLRFGWYLNGARTQDVSHTVQVQAQNTLRIDKRGEWLYCYANGVEIGRLIDVNGRTVKTAGVAIRTPGGFINSYKMSAK